MIVLLSVNITGCNQWPSAGISPGLHYLYITSQQFHSLHRLFSWKKFIMHENLENRHEHMVTEETLILLCLTQ